MRVPSFSNVWKVYHKWLQGPPLAPEFLVPYDGPECTGRTHECYDPARLIILSFFAFWVAFGVLHAMSSRVPTYRRLPFKKKTYWVSCCVSTVHAIIVLYGAVKYLLLRHHLFEGTICFARFKELDLFIGIGVGYFIYDTMWMFPFYFSWDMCFHHLLALFFLPAAFIFNQCSYICGFLLLTEASTPFVNMRWILHTLGMKNSKLYVINGVCMMIVFFFCRVVLLGFFLYV